MPGKLEFRDAFLGIFHPFVTPGSMEYVLFLMKLIFLISPGYRAIDRVIVDDRWSSIPKLLIPFITTKQKWVTTVWRYYARYSVGFREEIFVSAV